MLKILILYCFILIASGYRSISIAPGGLKGFYALGICKYIKENYCLDEYHFYGSSAGSWNALYLSLPFDNSYYLDEIMKINPTDFNNLYELEIKLKKIVFKSHKVALSAQSICR